MADFMVGASCSRKDPEEFPKDIPPVMAYVPFQQYNTVYQPELSLERGTIFPELDKPFYGRRGESR